MFLPNCVLIIWWHDLKQVRTSLLLCEVDPSHLRIAITEVTNHISPLVVGILEGPHTSKCITMKGEFTFIISNRINSSFTHSILTDPTKNSILLHFLVNYGRILSNIPNDGCSRHWCYWWSCWRWLLLTSWVVVLVKNCLAYFPIPKYKDLHEVYHCQSLSSGFRSWKVQRLGKISNNLDFE